MPRIRTIKPEFASDRKLSAISRGARLTFLLLITQADDDGLVLGSDRQLLGQLYPHDESVDLATLSRELRELVATGLVQMRMTADDAPVVELTNWSKHQRIDHRGKSLILPHLRPLSGESREGVASVSGESRAPTLDLGPGTVDPNHGAPTAPPAEPPPEVRPSVVNWPASVAASWSRQIGPRSYGDVGARLKIFADQYADPADAERALLAAVDNFARHRRLAMERGIEKPDNWPQFVRDLLDYVPATLKPQAEAA